MENYFKVNSGQPILQRYPNLNQHINVEPLFTAMFELADAELQNEPQALSAIVGDAIRYLATSVPSMDVNELPNYHKMMGRLYDLQDMFNAMSVVK